MNLNNVLKSGARIGRKVGRKANVICASPVTMAAISIGSAFLGYLAQKEAAKANNAALELYVRQQMDGAFNANQEAEIITMEEAKERGLIKENPEEKEKKEESTEETLQEKLRNQLKK